MKKRQMALFLFPEWGGLHVAAWRAAASYPDSVMDVSMAVEIARKAEEGKLHALFLADTLAFRHNLSPEALSRSTRAIRFEPLTLLSSLAMVTKRIGLVATASTTYNEPFHIARKFASLDHLSGGRAGWNVVTSGTPSESHNFGRDEHMEHDLRYERAEEFYDAVSALWNSWDDDAFRMDKASGVFFDLEKMHVPDYRGAHLAVRGPLNIARPPQGRPLIVQAGSSTPGLNFAARIAEVVFTHHQESMTAAQEFHGQLDEKVRSFGRSPDEVIMMPQLTLLIGRDEEDLRRKRQELDDLLDPLVGVSLLSALLETDLSGYPLDGPLPEITPTSRGAVSRQRVYIDKAQSENLSIRELAAWAASAGAFGGTPLEVADRMEEWARSGAADGFNLIFADLPDSLNLFVERVVPELQRRGLFHTDYRGNTLRENLGLARPALRGLCA